MAEKVTDALRARLDHDDDSVRLNAALDLADAQDPSALPVLLDALADERSVVRTRFARPALVRLGERAVPQLERASEATDPLVAVGAALALAQLDPSRRADALAALRRAIAAGERARDDALEALWHAPADTVALREDLRAVVGADGDGGWQTDARALALLLLARGCPQWPPARSLFVRALESDVAAVRRGGALALGHAGAALDDDSDRLLAVLRDEAEEVAVRIAAAYALARVGEHRTVPALKRLLADSVPALRVVAVRLLGELASDEPLYEPSDNVHFWLVSAHQVATVPSAEVAAPILAALDDDDGNVRRNAILALSWLRPADGGAVHRLERELEEPHVGPLAAEALTRIDGRVRKTLVDLEHLYPRVAVEWTAEKRAAFEQLFERTVVRGPGAEVTYDVPFPKHEFLRYVCDRHRLMLHGAPKGDLDVLKPLRDSIDSSDWGNVSGVYAEPDPVRPIYFAVVDRRRSFGLVNTCFALDETGEPETRLEDPSRPRHYRLSVGFPAVGNDVWREGWVYALPGDTFEFWEEWTSRVPVRPLFKIAVQSTDLPLALSYADIRKRGSVWIDREAEFPYLEDVWALPIKPLPDDGELS